jgi:predicted phosphodiesterase
MTKKQNKVLTWLLSKPGYLKKGVQTAYVSYPELVSFDNFEKAFHEAKKVNKEISASGVKYIGHDSKKSKPIVINTGHKALTAHYPYKGKYIILGCVHIPAHNYDFYKAFLSYLKDNKSEISGLIIAGDFVDMMPLSNHDKGNISTVTLDYEYNEANVVLNEIEAILAPSIHKAYIWGNHEDRYNRYMRQVDNSKLGAALQSPTEALNLLSRGYTVLEDWKKSYVTLGGYLDVLHGEFTNIHTAKKHLDTYRKSCLFFHTHRKQIYTEGHMGAFNCGSMGDFKNSAFGYASRAMVDSWTNAFAVVNIDSDGYYHIDIPTWINKKFIIGSKVYNH